MDEYFGDPQVGCRPECLINSDCAGNQACQKHRCVDPCKLGSVCGVGAVCKCIDHTATCGCPDGYEGDAFVQCYPRRKLSMCDVECGIKGNTKSCIGVNPR